MKVREVMSRGVVTVGLEASLRDAVAKMASARVRHLPVVDARGRLAGIVTDRDVRHRLFEPVVFPDLGTVPVETLLERVPVREVMSAPVITTAPDTPLVDAARTMLEDKVGALPVLEDGRVVGILTETDLLRRIVKADDAACTPVDCIVSFP